MSNRKKSIGNKPASKDRARVTRGPRAPTGFPVVGIGASAGGLEAFMVLLKHLPVDTGMAFVLIQHLDPLHESILAHLLTKATALPVLEAAHNLRLLPDHVYVIPPNTQLTVKHRTLKLTPRPERQGDVRPIDKFLESLARDLREQCIGVILSGTGTDGTLGLEAIKSEEGITFAQDDSARYDAMPRSAVASGCVDFVLSCENIAAELGRIAKHPFVNSQGFVAGSPSIRKFEQDPSAPKTPQPVSVRAVEDAAPTKRGRRAETPSNGYQKVLTMLHDRCGLDFSQYKSTTIQRRLQRRMILGKHTSFEEYVKYLQDHSDELDQLRSDALINVTCFFRNPLSFETLKQKVFTAILSRPRDENFRVWVPGCSTGQEAYSIAIAFAEVCGTGAGACRLQIFATDVNEASLDSARHGFFSKSATESLTTERLKRFFVEERGGYRVSKSLRETIVFARHDILKDPPFSNLDLISCRNLLIYLELAAQNKTIPMFHYALKPGGHLLLGSSEIISSFQNLYAILDKKHRVYKRKDGPSPLFHMPVAKPGRVRPDSNAPVSSRFGITPAPQTAKGELTAQQEADRILVNRFAPPGVIIDSELQILQFRGQTGLYLEPPAGKATYHILKMIRKGLLLPLQSAIAQAKKKRTVVRKEGLRLIHDGTIHAVNLEVIPLSHLRDFRMLILFEEAAGATRSAKRSRGKAGKSPVRKEDTVRFEELERELIETRDYLHAVQEQYEAANEELRTSNDEAQSANEELQSVNEEIETSKEELESANEELVTLNSELSNRNTELNRLNADLNNLHSSTKVPIIFADWDLTIRSFNSAAQSMFNLIATDVARHLSALPGVTMFPTPGQRQSYVHDETSPLRGETTPHGMEDIARRAMESAAEQECEVKDDDGRWFLLRATPYMTLEHTIEGVVLVFINIDEIKRSELKVKAARDYAEAVVRTARSPMIVLRSDMIVNTANTAFYKTFKLTPRETEGISIFDLREGEWNIPLLRSLLEDIVPRNSFFDELEITQEFSGLGSRTLLFNARQLIQDDGNPPMILLVIEDETERLRASEATTRLAAIVQSSEDAILTKTLDGVITSWNPGAERMYGYDASEIIGKNISMLFTPNRSDDWMRIHEKLRRNERVINFETEWLRNDGSAAFVLLSIAPLIDNYGELTGASVIARDISELKKAHQQVRMSETRYRRLFEAAHDGVLIVNAATGTIAHGNACMAELLGSQPESLTDKDLWDIGLFKDRASGTEALHHLRNEKVWHHETALINKLSGRQHQVEVMGNVYEESGNQVIQFNIRDITARREVESALSQARAQLADRASQLEQLVAERTAELRDIADQLHTFVYSVAHDLRGPLRAMEGFAQMLKEEQGHLLEAQGIEYLDKISVSAAHLDMLLRNLLEYSRVSRMEIFVQPASLSAIVNSAMNELRDEILKTAARIRVRTPMDFVQAHEPTLLQIMINLLSNAMKFVKPGTAPRIDVSSEECGDMVRLSVKDNGIGIAVDQQQKIFKVFERGHEKKFPGTGIGLAIVQKGLERMGGRLGVESSAGNGSCFWIELPKVPSGQ